MDDYTTALDAIEQMLWGLICGGGGDAETVRAKAEEIANLFFEEE